MPGLVVTIDGTAGSGKSTLGRRVARAMGYRYINSGAMYRALGWAAIQKNIGLDDEQALSELAESVKINFEERGGENRVLVDGVDVTEDIYTPQVSEASSAIAVFSPVRTAMVERQRKMAAGGSVVIEGRDIGTVVLPDADLKIFTDADVAVRAQRRAKELEERDLSQPLETVLEEIKSRDRRDRTRTDSPLEPAPDALRMDTTDCPVDELVNRIIGEIEKRLSEKSNTE